MSTLNTGSHALPKVGRAKNVWTEVAQGWDLARLISGAETEDPSLAAGVTAADATRRRQMYWARGKGWHQFRFLSDSSGATTQGMAALVIPHAGPDVIAAGSETLAQWALEPPVWRGTLTFDSVAKVLSNLAALTLNENFYEAITRANTHIKDRRVFWDPESGSGGTTNSVTMFMDLASDEAVLFYVPNGGTFQSGSRIAVIGKAIQ